MDFKEMASMHTGNHPMLKLIQILTPIRTCDVLVCCREDIVEILKYMMI